ncbi:MAG: response regulator [Tissierellales bacterium]|nr:response regulator [Tissierellales bacterium]MBN2828470.1 response regulator [Tissierellales bacterium]
MHKIIIIDDSTVVRMRIMKILQDFGYSNVFGYNSANTISSFLKTYLFDVDLIISEINLKGISGYELLEKIRNSPEFYKTPVILMNESTDEETIREAMTAGATDFLQKPF